MDVRRKGRSMERVCEEDDRRRVKRGLDEKGKDEKAEQGCLILRGRTI